MQKVSPEKSKIYQRRWHQRHPGRRAALKRAWIKNNPEKTYQHNRKQRLKQYGLTIEAYEVWCKRLKNKCEICHGYPLIHTRKLTVDHCHKTGRIRGLLCSTCNLALGYFKDNPKILQSAIKYLQTRGGLK